MTISRSVQGKAGTSIAHGARSVGRAASEAAANPWMIRLMRFGYVVRGIIYLLPGILALGLALHMGRQDSASLTQTGAIATIGRQPMGQVLLVVIAVGLAGYALWGLTRAFLDPLQEGGSSGGILKRVGYGWSALVHIALCVATLAIIAGSRAPMADNKDWTADLLARPWGGWLVGTIGILWLVGVGIGQIVAGWKGTIEDDLDLAGRHPAERWWAVRLGRFGVVSRGVVFAIIGFFLVTAAWHARAEEARGMDGVLLELLSQPYGRILLMVASLGLVAFGLFSILCARWMHVSPPPASHAANDPSRGQP